MCTQPGVAALTGCWGVLPLSPVPACLLRPPGAPRPAGGTATGACSAGTPRPRLPRAGEQGPPALTARFLCLLLVSVCSAPLPVWPPRHPPEAQGWPAPRGRFRCSSRSSGVFLGNSGCHGPGPSLLTPGRASAPGHPSSEPGPPLPSPPFQPLGRAAHRRRVNATETPSTPGLHGRRLVKLLSDASLSEPQRLHSRPLERCRRARLGDSYFPLRG